ncbi:hypothetical protein BVY03_02340 [bacterium K02(2017)]|nr:hypothetical protein BVY03_02340 [bacterium K02(2017)]
MSEDKEHMAAHVRVCKVVFLCLLVLTGITVWVSYLKVSTAAAVAIGLSIASIKGTLVLAYFMHLVSEKKLIYFTLILTLFFFFVALLLPVFTAQDPIQILIPHNY